MFQKESSSKISRKDAIKRMGGLAIGLPLGISNLSVKYPEKQENKPSSDFPFIKKRNKKPNILWITAEGVPLSVLSCYGSRIMQTPNIDRIAHEGMQFNNAFCTNALCAPSRATLLTGKYSHLCGMTTNPGAQPDTLYFDPHQQTFPKLLKQAGYKTGIVGKWHLAAASGETANPGVAGFDYFVYKLGAGGPYYQSEGFLQNPSLGSKEIQHKEYKGYSTDTFTDLAIKGMEQLKEPFCMCMQYFNDHYPFDPPHQYEHIYDDQLFPAPGSFWDDYKDRSVAAQKATMRVANMRTFNPPKEYSPRQLAQWNYQQLMRHFLGTLKSQDDNIGRLLKYLDDSGRSDNTIVVLTSDHGFFLGEHGWFDKRFMYEESIRVPWMIRYPGKIKPGSHSDAWTVNIDNAPTILDLAGVKVPDDMQGRSLRPIMEGNTPGDWRKSMYYHYYEFAPPMWVLPNYGIRTERYKLINYYTINEWELFDLKRDPHEMSSVMIRNGMDVSPEYKEVLQDHLKKLSELRKFYKDDTGKPVKFWPRRLYNG